MCVVCVVLQWKWLAYADVSPGNFGPADLVTLLKIKLQGDEAHTHSLLARQHDLGNLVALLELSFKHAHGTTRTAVKRCLRAFHALGDDYVCMHPVFKGKGRHLPNFCVPLFPGTAYWATNKFRSLQ